MVIQASHAHRRRLARSICQAWRTSKLISSQSAKLDTVEVDHFDITADAAALLDVLLDHGHKLLIVLVQQPPLTRIAETFADCGCRISIMT